MCINPLPQSQHLKNPEEMHENMTGKVFFNQFKDRNRLLTFSISIIYKSLHLDIPAPRTLLNLFKIQATNF